MSLPFEIISVVVCDDVRREWNGKDIIIGAYGGGMRVNVLPATISVGLWLEMKPIQMGDFQCKLRVMGPKNSMLFEMPASSPLKFVNTQHTAAAYNGVPLTIETEGALEFQISVKDDDWTTIKRFEVAKGGFAVANPTDSLSSK